jgi:hypothetical protein
VSKLGHRKLQYLDQKAGNIEWMMEIILGRSTENDRKREQGQKLKKPQKSENYL